MARSNSAWPASPCISAVSKYSIHGGVDAGLLSAKCSSARSTEERTILAAGATKIGETLQRRYVYDITPGDETKWIRLRDTGSKITLTIKEITNDAIDGTQETEIAVSDFDSTNVLLNKLGYQPKAYQENKRISFTLDGGEVEIDMWPRIPPYAEIESSSNEHVIAIAGKLGYRKDQLTGENTTKVYARYGIDLADIADLRF